MKFGSLFAGIGGIDLGLERAGMECIWQVENDEYCTRVLEKHWPEVQRFGDVRECTNLPPVDLIAGGFPCQPHSIAGQRRGAEDNRNLWPEFSRIIGELKPRYVLAENVPGIITTYIDTVLFDLEGQGYTCATFNLPALAFDAPHRRERIFIVAHRDGPRQQSGSRGGSGGKSSAPRNNSRGSGKKLADSEGRQNHKRRSRNLGEAPAGGQGSNAAVGHGGQDMADGDQSGLEGHAGDVIRRNQPGREQAQANRSATASGVRGHISDADKQGPQIGTRQATPPILGTDAPDRKNGTHWTAEPSMGELVNGVSGGLVRFRGRTATGIPNRVNKLRALGNAVVPQVAEWIGARILEHDK
jgi:DNA (cytosine-5)-methyltransferase 1